MWRVSAGYRVSQPEGSEAESVVQGAILININGDDFIRLNETALREVTSTNRPSSP